MARADGHGISRDKDLTSLIFSWKLQDITNNKLYKSKVKEIPRTFSSLSDYLATFQTPLVEEIRSELNSNLDLIAHATVWDMISVRKSEITVSDKKLVVYSLVVKHLKDGNRHQDPNYKPPPPMTGDVLAFTTVKRPKAIGDLIRSNRPCTLALVSGSDEDEEGPLYNIEVRPSKALAASWEMGLTKKEPLYVFVLANLVTSSRIWTSLNQDQIQCRLLNIALYNGPTYNCGCWSPDEEGVSSILEDDLKQFNLNDSQRGAVLSCLSGRKCNHQPAAKLIWGPPGTGKTKTVSTLLWCLLAEKCRTVTCAPTNVAVLQIAKRLMGLLEEKVPSSCSFYGTGDVLLYGNEDKMKIKENGNLKNIFLKHRVRELLKCSSYLTGWNNQLEELKALLENCFIEYNRFLLQEEEDLEPNSEEEETSDEPNTFRRYIRTRFVTISELLRKYMSVFRKHLPSSMMTSSITQTYDELNHALYSISDGLSDCSADFDFEKVFKTSLKIDDSEASEDISTTRFELLPDDDKENTAVMSFLQICNLWRDQSTFEFWEDRIRCLQIVSTLQRKLKLPENPSKQKMEEFCIVNATLIMCTASGSFRLRSIPDMKPLELLLIDEAAQLKECESLIPMQIPGLRHAILIGDECQLPAVVMSEICEKANFGRSLFERLVLLGHEKHLLNIQYRMHPSISIFPNTKFYKKQITDGENVKSVDYKKNYLDGRVYGPYSFINVHSSGKEGSDIKHSKMNMAEVDMVSALVEELFNGLKKTKKKISVGVISPYTAQVHAITKKLGKRYEKVESEFSVSVKSVDGFQGAEEDVIIMSTVRSNMNGSIGFLSNLQRTNVALTRAKHCLWIVGNGTTMINSGSIWKDLVVDAKIRGCFFDTTSDGIVIEDAGTVIDQLDTNTIDSSLFSEAKWKVFFTDDFKNSFVGIKEASIRFEIVQFIKMLSNGLSMNNTKLKEGSFSSQKLLNHLKSYNIQEYNLYWSVEIFKIQDSSNYTQVLNFWDTLPREEFAKKLKLLKKLNSFIEMYSADYASKCRFRCLDEDLEVPMAWPGGNQNIVQPTDHPFKCLSDDLATHFASLNLGENSGN